MVKTLAREDMQSGWTDRSLRMREKILEEKAENGDPEKAEQGGQETQKQSKSFYGFTPVHLSIIVHILHWSLLWSSIFFVAKEAEARQREQEMAKNQISGTRLF
jgi:hypothetical protein